MNLNNKLHLVIISTVVAPIVLSADTVVPIDKIIKEKRAYYDFNGTSPLPVSQKDVDSLKSSGVILNLDMQKKLKGKKTPKELEESLAVMEGRGVGDIEDLAKEMEDKPKFNHVFILKKGASSDTDKPQKKLREKSTMMQKLYHREQ